MLWSAVAKAIALEQSRYESSSIAGKYISRCSSVGMLRLQSGDVAGAKSQVERAYSSLTDLSSDVIEPEGCVGLRCSNLSHALESLATLEETLCFVTDEEQQQPFVLDDSEHLAGLLGAAQALAKYSMTHLESLGKCKGIVDRLLEVFLDFEFRNGPLRRKFDGLKYASRRFADLTYEQSLVGRFYPDEKFDFELDDVRKRYERRDELREEVVKKSRDVQKAAKKAIYAAHRGDKEKTEILVEEAVKIAKEIFKVVEEWPPLRRSFSPALEEYVEAELFRSWLFEDKNLVEKFPLPISAEEYLGGVADLCGEIGRVGVKAASERDRGTLSAVKETTMLVYEQFLELDLPPKMSKKTDMIMASLNKLDTLQYELDLNSALEEHFGADLKRGTTAFVGSSSAAPQLTEQNREE